MWRLVVFITSAYAEFHLDPIAYTKLGVIRGVRAQDGDYSKFLGVPYAKVDENNPFGDSKPYPKFEADFEAHNDTAICPQVAPNGEAIGTINCLNLNIFVPNNVNSINKLPILVWIHGGSFKEGHAGLYGPKNLIKHDVIVVSLNYRLGVYGFMCLDTPEVPGNQGLKDQLLALKWIKEHIDDFGGDSNEITVYGESAGAACVEMHLVSDNESMFNRAILSSGSMFRKAAIGGANENVPLVIAKELSFVTTNVSEALSFLKTTDARFVVNAAYRLKLEYHACVEKEFNGVERFLSDAVRRETLAKAKNMSLLIGVNNDECLLPLGNVPSDTFDNIDPFKTFLVDEKISHDLYNIIRRFYIGDERINEDVKWNLIDFCSDVNFNYPAQKSIERLLKSGAHVYEYVFSYNGGRSYAAKLNISEGGASHTDDLRYIFDMKEDIIPKEDDELIVNRMTMIWANFVKYGNPTPEVTELLPITWPEAATDSLNFMNINTDMFVGSRPFYNRMAFWDLFYELKKLCS